MFLFFTLSIVEEEYKKKRSILDDKRFTVLKKSVRTKLLEQCTYKHTKLKRSWDNLEEKSLDTINDLIKEAKGLLNLLGSDISNHSKTDMKVESWQRESKWNILSEDENNKEFIKYVQENQWN